MIHLRNSNPLPDLRPPNKVPLSGKQWRHKARQAKETPEMGMKVPGSHLLVVRRLLGALILLIAGLPLFSRLALSGEAGKVRVLDDFEAESSLSQWQGPLRLSSAHPAHGRNCLEARFDASSSGFSLLVKKGDWGGYDHLFFDVYSPEALPQILSFRLYDAVGGDGPDVARFDLYDAEGKLFLDPGWTHVEVGLRNLKASSELRSLALDRIRRFSISTDSSTRQLALYFDNFRLTSGTEGTDTASAVAPQDTITRLEGRWVSILQAGPAGQIPESETVRQLRERAQQEYQALETTIQSAEIMGLDTIYSQAEEVTAEIGLYFRPLLPWFNRDREKEKMFAYVGESCRQERKRLERLLTGEVRLPERDDTQIAGPALPPYPPLHGLPIEEGFFRDETGRPLFVISLHGPSVALQRFFATPLQHIESYSVGGGSRWTVDNSPVYEAFQKFPDTHRVGWDGWCGHLIRDLDSMGGKKENTVICLESPHIREAVERYIEREWRQWLKNPNLLYNIMAYELQYICYCERSQQMFRDWLEKKHGSVERLNETWSTHYQSFREVVAPPTKNARPLPGTNRAQWYDWACFNQDRFSDYLAWVKSVIRRFDPVTPLAAGGSFSMLYGGNGTSGIDEEQIINRVDDVIIHEGSGSTMGMDLQMALSEKPKPLCDPEMNLEEVRYLLPHLLHGKSVIQLWHWPDQPPYEYPHLINDSPAHSWKFSLSDVSALLRAVLDARRLSREMAAFTANPAPVAILYSRTSMLQLPPEMLTWHRTPYLRELENAYEASRFLDTKTTFVSEKQILAGKLSSFKVLVVPAASHMRSEVVESVTRFLKQGGSVVILPSSFLSDEYNRPANYLSRIGVQVEHIEQIMGDRTGELEQSYDQSFHERVTYHSPHSEPLVVRSVGLFAKDPPALQAEGTRQVISLSGAHQVLAAFPNGHPALVSVNQGQGKVYYAATSFPRQSLSLLLNRIFEASGVRRAVRVRSENGELLSDVEARFVEGSLGRLLYMVNFGQSPVNALVEVDGHPCRGFYDLRKQEKLAGNHVLLPAGETMIFRLD